MPPKQQKQGGGAKVKDDKTFGMKNKNKSAKVQKFIQQVEQANSMKGKNKEDLAKEKAAEEKRKQKLFEEARKKEAASLMAGAIIAPKVPFGVDPKTFYCPWHKAGACDKGTKCKYSHDKDAGRKTAKVNLYEDVRDAGKDKDKLADTMDTWDDAKLASVVLSKAGNPKTTTDIVCKYFIAAIEEQKYGWFWECPNGGVECKYQHKLPKGFVLKADKKAQEEAAKKQVISLEDFLETERHKLKAPLTPVTPESFAIWKKTRVDKKIAEEEAREKAKAQQRAAGKITGMSGKDLFDYNADLLGGDESDDGDNDWDLQRFLASRDPNERPADYDDASNSGVDDDSESESEDDDDEENAEASGSGSNGVGEVTKGVEEVKV